MVSLRVLNHMTEMGANSKGLETWLWGGDSVIIIYKVHFFFASWQLPEVPDQEVPKEEQPARLHSCGGSEQDGIRAALLPDQHSRWWGVGRRRLTDNTHNCGYIVWPLTWFFIKLFSTQIKLRWRWSLFWVSIGWGKWWLGWSRSRDLWAREQHDMSKIDLGGEFLMSWTWPQEF